MQAGASGLHFLYNGDKDMKSKSKSSTMTLTEAFKNGFTEFDTILIPENLRSFSNQFNNQNNALLMPKSISGENLMKMMKNAQACTLKQQAQWNLIRKFKDTDFNPFIDARKVDPLPLIPALLDELLKNETDKMRLVNYFTEIDCDRLIKRFLVPKCLEGWLRHLKYDLREVVNQGVKECKQKSIRIEKNGKTYYFPEKYVDSAYRIIQALENRDFTIVNGPAGSGKSTLVIKELKNNMESFQRAAICTLSNTIGLMFKSRFDRITNFSVTKVRFVNGTPSIKDSCKLKDYDYVVIDEFSQWGVENLDVLETILDDNPNAFIYFLGDLNQIPTFLSSGSLLHSLMDSFPDKVKQLSVMHRFENPELMQKIIEGEPVEITPLRMGQVDLKKVDCLITGTNDHVDLLNTMMIAVKFDLNSMGMKLSDILRRLEKTEIDVIAEDTFKINETKICSCQRFKAKWTGYEYLLDDFLPVDENTLNFRFKLGYAITVNKSQGLEWDRTIVYMTQSDRNLMNRNALYVALSRSRSGICVVTSDPAVSKAEIAGVLKQKTFKMLNVFKAASTLKQK